MVKKKINETTIQKRVEAFENVLTLISDETIKEFCGKLIGEADNYFFSTPASSTGKYHPAYALGKGGLMRHSKAVALILKSILEMDLYGQDERQKDLLICAAIVHDIKKYGTNHKYTVKNHPELASEYILKTGKKFKKLSTEDIQYIADAVVTHMGKWGTTKPETEAQKLLHMADCLASRKFLNVEFPEESPIVTEELLTEIETIEPGDYVMNFGKYKGLPLKEIDRSYLTFLVEKFVGQNHPAVGYARKYLKQLK